MCMCGQNLGRAKVLLSELSGVCGRAKAWSSPEALLACFSLCRWQTGWAVSSRKHENVPGELQTKNNPQGIWEQKNGVSAGQLCLCRCLLHTETQSFLTSITASSIWGEGERPGPSLGVQVWSVLCRGAPEVQVLSVRFIRARWGTLLPAVWHRAASGHCGQGHAAGEPPAGSGLGYGVWHVPNSLALMASSLSPLLFLLLSRSVTSPSRDRTSASPCLSQEWPLPLPTLTVSWAWATPP